jgi:hypothetical protein
MTCPLAHSGVCWNHDQVNMIYNVNQMEKMSREEKFVLEYIQYPEEASMHILCILELRIHISMMVIQFI